MLRWKTREAFEEYNFNLSNVSLFRVIITDLTERLKLKL